MNFPIAPCWFLFVCRDWIFLFVSGVFVFLWFWFVFVCFFFTHKPWILKIHEVILKMSPSCQMDWNHFSLLADLIVVKLHCHIDIFAVYMFWIYLELLHGHTKLECYYKIKHFCIEVFYSRHCKINVLNSVTEKRDLKSKYSCWASFKWRLLLKCSGEKYPSMPLK